MRLLTLIPLFIFLFTPLTSAQGKKGTAKKNQTCRQLLPETAPLPLNEMSLENIVVSTVFRGYPEVEIFSLIQENFFYALPQPVDVTATYQPGYIEIREYPDLLRTDYEEPNTRVRIELHYNKISTNARQISKKVTFIRSAEIDTVNYHFSDEVLEYVESKVFGRLYFTEPRTRLDKIERLWYKYRNVLFF